MSTPTPTPSAADADQTLPRDGINDAEPSSAPSRARTILAVVLGGVALALVLAFVVVSQRGGTDTDTTPSAGEGTEAGSATPSADTGRTVDEPSEDPAEQPSAAPSEDPVAPAEVTCWDGTTAADVGRCAALTGVAGLAWVFPSMDAAIDSCVDARIYDGKLTAVTCGLADGTRERVTYSEYASAGLVRDHYVEKYGRGQRRGDRLFYGPALIGNGWQMSVTYADGRRFAATAGGPDAARVQTILETVSLRPTGEVDERAGLPPS